MGLSYRLADAPPYLQTLHAERMERIRRVNLMQAAMASAPVMIAAPVCSVPVYVGYSNTPKDTGEIYGPFLPIVRGREVIRAVAAHYGVAEADLIGACRRKKFAVPRHVAIYVIRKFVKPTPSFPMIGRMFDGRDHTSAIFAFFKIQRLAFCDCPDEKLRADLLSVAEALGRRL